MEEIRETPLLRLAICTATLMVLFGPSPSMAQRDAISTADILSRTGAAAHSCAAWRVSGTCFWLHCSFFKCSVKTSMRVSHYSPDAVVSTFHDAATHPWNDWGRSLASATQSSATSQAGLPADSAGTRTINGGRGHAAKYRDADAIGHPGNLASMLPGGGTTPALCPTAVRPFQPYFSSYLDAFVWRAIVPLETLHPAALTPGLREIGNWPLNSWGSVYPRDGSLMQQHPVKAAAVVSQRVGDIVTRSAQPHVYLPLPTDGRRMIGNHMVWQPPTLKERDASTGKWQMLSPAAQSSCQVFGDNDSILPASWGDARTSTSEGYAFNLWRPYSCCSRAGQVFLGAVTF